jgi:hypothetical protein
MSRGFVAAYPAHVARETALLLLDGHRLRIVRHKNRQFSACLVPTSGPIHGREDPHQGASARGALESQSQLPVSHRRTSSFDELIEDVAAVLSKVPT